MAVGSGLSATVGFAQEMTVGVPVAVTRFFEFDSETLSLNKHTAQGAGLRGGGLVKRAQRRVVVAREAKGDITGDAVTNGLGLLLTHMLGSFGTVPTSIGGGLYRQIHNIGPTAGKSFTTQVLRPDTSGVLPQQAFTYPGCKITDWDISVAQHGQVKLKLGIDALDEATPTNGFAATVTSASSIVGAASISTVATIPAGSYVVINTGLLAEVVVTGTPSGVGPYTIPITNAGGATQAHASGVYVGSATNVNYGAATALATASYTAGANLFHFAEGKVISGGVTSVVSGLWTNTGGTPVANIRTVSIKGKNALKTDRFGLGSYTRSEQIDNNWREYTAALEVEYNGRAFYDAYASDSPLALVLSFTTAQGGVLQFYCPIGFQEDGTTPNVAGPDIIIQKLTPTILDDGVNGALQVVYTSTDVAL